MEFSDHDSFSNYPPGRKFGREVGVRTRRVLGEIHSNANREHKRELPRDGKDELRGKKPVADGSSRPPPVTRKFGAQQASSRPYLPTQEAKKAKTVPENNEFGDCIFVDADGDSPPEPMFLESPLPSKPDNNPEENQMEEVVMEDIINEEEEEEEEEEEPIIDIDCNDKNNQLAAIEYVEDLYSHYRKIEGLSCVPPDYMARQADINEKMRAILVDWLIEVHDKFGLMPETLFLTVNIIDRFLSQQPVVRKKLQLVGLVAMLLACKYEEVSVPVVEDLVLISDNAYCRKEILEMESLVLNTLQFNMSLPTPYVFLRRFLKAAESGTKLEQLSFFLLELCLVEYEMLRFQPSLLAAASVYTAQCSLYGFRQWSKTCEWHANYSEHDLSECSRMIVGLHQRASTGRLTGVHRKYCTSKFGYSSKCDPPVFILQQ
ncbi:hypothetical protein MLD38_028697 [Melastoma candidum]|uniref:Uncharacterized protein n=1 Tax=Melastoma candidum TaxID=119954 RepID=A0ACB9N3K3_9MYRT|nr:hypothetical protein MLD38_028697 [Melastoma candidum]